MSHLGCVENLKKRITELEAALKEANTIIHNRAGGLTSYMRKEAAQRAAEIESALSEVLDWLESSFDDNTLVAEREAAKRARALLLQDSTSE